MSLGGAVLDAVEKAAIDYALSKGVVVVASAGNEGKAGMGYPGAYEPVISVAASGWKNEFTTSDWWNAQDVADPTVVGQHYITDFSSRPLPGQDLDVAAPGSWVVGPWQLNSGATNFFFIGGTSQASPHVAGIAALLLQKKSSLTYVDITAILKETTTELPPSCVETVIDPNTDQPVTICWEAGASGNGLVNAQKALARIKR
jgi:subtilisin family serine protease